MSSRVWLKFGEVNSTKGSDYIRKNNRGYTCKSVLSVCPYSCVRPSGAPYHQDYEIIKELEIFCKKIYCNFLQGDLFKEILFKKNFRVEFFLFRNTESRIGSFVVHDCAKTVCHTV